MTDGEPGPRRQRPSEEAVLEFLVTQPLLQGFPAPRLQQIARALEVRSYEPGEYLLKEGAHADGLIFLWRGQAAVPPDAAGASGRQGIVMHPGDFFGQAAAAGPRYLQKADVIARTPAMALLLPYGALGPLQAPDAAPAASDADAPPLMEKILRLERLEVDFFRGVTPPEANLYPRIFGGQLLGQALRAACGAVDPQLHVHSLHSYFLVAGEPAIPVLYRVERIRDGHSFATRHVVGVQKGRNIFSMHVSFQRPEDGFEHQIPMPAHVCAPEEVPSFEELQKRYHTDPRIPLDVRTRYAGQRRRAAAVDIRFCDPVDRVEPGKRAPRQLIWMRVRGPLGDDPVAHRCALAYASDFTFLEAALMPHGLSTPNPRMVMASLDHCMWFHRPFRADQWLLYEIESPRSSNSRGYCVGRVYTQGGELVVSVAQEGLIRITGGPRHAPALPVPQRAAAHEPQPSGGGTAGAPVGAALSLPSPKL